MVELGSLKEVKDLRSVWAHEALDFTPWLAENIDLLGETLGFDISVEETESSVGSFNVDIFASEVGTDRKIIIENQLEDTNHDHLGKIITYASGKDADVIVACFRRIIANRVTSKVEPMVDGHAGFLFLDKNDRPMIALHWEKYLQHIVEKYNKIYRIQMPKVTPHVCRHTFFSNMAKSGMNPKTLQYIMGHSDISVTLNVYTHVQFDDAQAELLRVAEA